MFNLKLTFIHACFNLDYLFFKELEELLIDQLTQLLANLLMRLIKSLHLADHLNELAQYECK